MPPSSGHQRAPALSMKATRSSQTFCRKGGTEQPNLPPFSSKPSTRSQSAATPAPRSRASEKRNGMRFCRRKSTSGRPTCTALKPNTSSTALSNCASSQPRTYAPWGVPNHPERDERSPLYFCAPFCTKDGRMDVVPVKAFKDNYVWTLRNASHAAVVDPGEARPVLDYLASQNLKLAAILATHHHPDHV